jgi:hypothetical protein
MGYTTPANTEYFYNEMTIPTGQDPIGSYFMANGFSGGYFGIRSSPPPNAGSCSRCGMPTTAPRPRW